MNRIKRFGSQQSKRNVKLKIEGLLNHCFFFPKKYVKNNNPSDWKPITNIKNASPTFSFSITKTVVMIVNMEMPPYKIVTN
jgi:hypothetical protein